MFMAGITSGTRGVSSHSHMAQGPAHLPLSVAEVLLGGAVLLVLFLQHFFFHLFLLCLIAFDFVSAHCVYTDFLFSSFI